MTHLNQLQPKVLPQDDFVVVSEGDLTGYTPEKESRVGGLIQAAFEELSQAAFSSAVLAGLKAYYPSMGLVPCLACGILTAVTAQKVTSATLPRMIKA